MDKTNTELVALRAEFHLTRNEIAEITSSGRASVEHWLLPPTSPHYRRMPKKALRLMRLELGLGRARFKHIAERAAA